MVMVLIQDMIPLALAQSSDEPNIPSAVSLLKPTGIVVLVLSNANPYCDKVNYAVTCHDRKDYDEDTGLYPCNDGTDKADWRDCEDATEKSDNNDDDRMNTITTTSTTSNIDCETWSHKLDVRLVVDNAQVDLLNSMYNDPMTKEETDRYNAQVDNLNKNGIVLDTEVAGFNAECATAPPTTQSKPQTTVEY